MEKKKKERKIITKRDLLLADVCYLQGFLLKPRLSLMLFSDAFPSCRVLTRCQEALWKVRKLLVAAQAVWKRC